MGPILLGAAVLFALLLLLHSFLGADPKALAKVLRGMGTGLLALLALILFAIGRPFSALVVAALAWGVFTGGRVFLRGWPRGRFGAGRMSAPAKGQTSSVRTAWLEMELNHDSGEMNGTILQGEHAGKTLANLDRDALLAFYALAAAQDEETKRLLDAYLDRTLGPGWQAGTQHSEPPPAATASSMTRTEALKVLGLGDGASADDIHAAHRRLMMQLHPDHGGTDYLASKINEAKDILLGG